MDFQQINETAKLLRNKGIIAPEIGIVLGTGLSALVAEIEAEVIVNYEDIRGFARSTVESHAGKLIYGSIGSKNVLVMQGRFHFYEGYSMQQVTFPVRVMAALGVKFLLLSNAAGGINLNFKKGELMLITDHINLLPTNPLIGKNDDTMGPRFPDMSAAYNPDLNKLFISSAKKLNITLHSGVYAAVAGPNLETRAEYRFLKKIGADVVGMSTVPEVIVANHISLPCAAISVITDECDPDNLKPIAIEEIIATAGKAEVGLVKLFMEVVSARLPAN